MKKILSMILALVMVFALGATAFAAGEVTPPATGTEVAEEDTTKTPDPVADGTADTTEAPGAAEGATTAAAGENAASRTITINNDKTGHTYKAYQIFKGGLSQDGTILSDIQWGNGVNSEALLPALKKDMGEKFGADCTTAADVAKVLEAFTADETIQFSKIVNTHLEAVAGTAAAPVGGKYTITVPSDGYYLVRDEETVTAADGGTNFILQVIGNATVTPKTTNAPDVDKKVRKSSHNDVFLAKTAFVEVGSDAHFSITATIPANLTNYTNYTFQIVDTMSDGLTYQNDLKVHTDEGMTALTAGKDYKMDVNGQIITVTLNSDYVLANQGKTVVITYSATVNSNALNQERETNSVKVVYSNNPADSDSTGETVDNVVYVYNFDIVIDKVDGADLNKKLEGAEFILYKKNAAGDNVYYKWDDNNNKIEWVTDENAATKYATDANGAARFKGLDIGNYYLEEVKAPDGYNTLVKPQEDFIYADAHNDGNDIHTNTTLNGQNNRYEVTSQVKNNKGAVLPSTGGIGTTIFYVVGGLLMVGAAILLITKKRMHNNG